jgi:glyceraldehyde 3-phosphate dehydrogenase
MIQLDGIFKGTIAIEGGHLVVNGKKIRVTAERPCQP